MSVFYVLIVNELQQPLPGIGDWEAIYQAWDAADRAYEGRDIAPYERKYLVRIDSTGVKIEKSSI